MADNRMGSERKWVVDPSILAPQDKPQFVPNPDGSFSPVNPNSQKREPGRYIKQPDGTFRKAEGGLFDMVPEKTWAAVQGFGRGLIGQEPTTSVMDPNFQAARAGNTAGVLGSIGTDMPGLGAIKGLGMLVGPKALGGVFKHADAIVAQKLLDNKMGGGEIFKSSGGYQKGLDDAWKRNIDDRMSMLDPTLIGGAAHGDYSLGTVFKHPELYKAYPEIANMKLTLNHKLSDRGQFSVEKGGFNPTIEINPNKFKDLADMHSTILHEVQHYIQNKEGWQAGGAPEAFDALSGGKEASKKIYRRLVGEAEARNIQKQFLEGRYQPVTSDVNPTELIQKQQADELMNQSRDLKGANNSFLQRWLGRDNPLMNNDLR